MSGITGENTVSTKRTQVDESALRANIVKRLDFYHVSPGGESRILFTSLTSSLDLEQRGYRPPSTKEILDARVGHFRNNFTVVSSINGEMLPYIDYLVTDYYVDILGRSTDAGEVFYFMLENLATTGDMSVRGSPLAVSGTIVAGETLFNVGRAFPIENLNHNTGAVLVYRGPNQQKMRRNSQNSSTVLDGDYYEVQADKNTASAIRFNSPAATDEVVTVVGFGNILDPTSSQVEQVYQTFGSMADLLATDCLEAFGFDISDPTRYDAGSPEYPDLQRFGDQVIFNTQAIAANSQDIADAGPAADIKDILGTVKSFNEGAGIQSTWLACDGSPIPPDSKYDGLRSLVGAAYSSRNSDLTSSAPTLGGQFGFSVDINEADEMAFVGGRSEDAGGFTASGRVDIFTYDGSTWNYLESVESPNPKDNGNFGAWVKYDQGTLAIGAPGENPGGFSDAGRVYVFDVSGPAALVDTLELVDPHSGALFGSSIDIDGTNLLVGAPGKNDTVVGGSVGKVYWYKWDSANWVYDSVIESPNMVVNGFFGSSIVLGGTDAYIGSEGGDGSVANSGTLYCYEIKNTGYPLFADYWDHIQTLESSYPESSGRFGASATHTNGVLAVGAPGETDNTFRGSGRAYIFRHDSTEFKFESFVSSLNKANNVNFGFSVASADGFISVGVYGESSGTVAQTGTTYTYEYISGAGVWELSVRVNTDPPETGSFMGYSVAMSGRWLASGAPGSSSSGPSKSGLAVVYEKAAALPDIPDLQQGYPYYIKAED